MNFYLVGAPSSVKDVGAGGVTPVVTRLAKFRILAQKLLVRVCQLQQAVQVCSTWGSLVTWTDLMLSEDIGGRVLTVVGGEISQGWAQQR